jgi:hypothetical protein
VARFKPKRHTFEGFYLDRDEVPESETGTRLFGGNYEYAFNESNTVGATYLNFQSDSLPVRDGMSVYNLRAYVAPFRRVPDISLGAEFAREENSDLIGSTAWMVQGAYHFSKAKWAPKVSYRYAFFEGDDPATTENEAFDGLFTGFYDWGTWWQGEIAGEYFISNSNLISHQLRLHATPNDAISTGLIFFDFLLDQPASFDPQVTSDAVAYELDWYMDWTVNDHFTLSFVAAAADPGKAIEQSSGRTDTFLLGMIFVAFSF